MNWNEVVVEVAFDITNAFSDALMNAGALSITVEDADLGTPAEQPLFDEPGADSNEYAWKRSRVIALLPADANAGAVLKKAAEECKLTEVPEFILREVPDEDWVRVTQSQFDPIHIGEKIWIVPSWHEIPDQSGIVLELDPGLAFGTGSHPTTRLCVLNGSKRTSKKERPACWIMRCGSGILGDCRHQARRQQRDGCGYRSPIDYHVERKCRTQSLQLFVPLAG